MNVKSAVNSVLQDGYVVIEDIVDKKHLDIIHTAMQPITDKLISKEFWGGFGALQGHIQQFPPRYHEYIFKDIMCNSLAVEIAHSILGDNMYCNFYSSNTNCPGSMQQSIHPDWTSLWPSQHVAHPPAALVVNIPLIDINQHNGSTEIWPRSHMIPFTGRIVTDETLDASGLRDASTRMDCPKGGLIIRDSRLWHRGCTNYSNTPRHMLALIYNIHWLKPDKPQIYDKKAKEILNNPRLSFNVTYTDEEIDHSVDPTEDRYQIINV
jgi:Phytanoyl-CoA dioxygenase (PhyH)